MLLMPNRKKIASVILGSRKTSPDGEGKKSDFVQSLGEEPETGSYKTPEDDEESHGPESAMDDFLSAVAAKDAKGMARAMRLFVDMCGDEPASEEE